MDERRSEEFSTRKPLDFGPDASLEFQAQLFHDFNGGGSVPVKGIGVDVVQVERLMRALERFGARMEKRLFTEGELEYCRRHKDPLPHLAARFAAKEATFKAIGTGLSAGVGWKQAEVIQPGGRQPQLLLSGAALEHFSALGCTSSHLTIAHDGGLAVACVVIEG
jgi:holo-[acyl-carrier protein] synthase